MKLKNGKRLHLKVFYIKYFPILFISENCIDVRNLYGFLFWEEWYRSHGIGNNKFLGFEFCTVPEFPVSPCPIYSKGVLISFTDSISSWKNFCVVTPMKEQSMKWIIITKTISRAANEIHIFFFAHCYSVISMPPKM